ncbi:hypothetical protein D3C86_1963960 [compost metagenome]
MLNGPRTRLEFIECHGVRLTEPLVVRNVRCKGERGSYASDGDAAARRQDRESSFRQRGDDPSAFTHAERGLH